jgi:type I restriction enzyme, S subunit
MTEKNIPKHWQIKKLGDVCKLKNGFAFKSTSYTNEGVPVVRISDINQGIVSSNKAVRVIINNEYENYLIEKNDILIAMSGATTGKFGIYKSNEKAYQNQRVGKFKILDESILDNQFLFHQINSLKRQIEKDAYGGAQPNISSKRIEQMTVAIPPLPEQKLIVSKIEELLSDLENGKQQLLLAQQQLKIYRQSLLKWAFEGELTNPPARRAGKNLKDSELPEGWKWVKLGAVLDKIEAGKSFKCNERTPHLNEVGVLKVSAVTWQVFNEYESKTVIEKDRINQNYFVQKDDFLFSRANTLDLVGAVVIVNSIERKLMLSDKTLRFHFSPQVSKKYILYYLRSKKGRNEIQRLSTGNQMSMRNIGQERIKQIEFPFPTLEEQQLIVDELESKLTVCDKIEETISQSLLQVESLKQSILKKAFEGKLV